MTLIIIRSQSTTNLLSFSFLPHVEYVHSQFKYEDASSL